MEIVAWIIVLIATFVLVLRICSLIFQKSAELQNKQSTVVAFIISKLNGSRNLEGFLVGFGACVICFVNVVSSTALLILIAAVSGFISFYMYKLLVQELSINEKHVKFTVDQTLGKSGEVVQLIPPRKYGIGKIMVIIGQEKYELDAITNHVYKLEKGLPVKIIAIENDELLIVGPASSL